MKDINFNEVQEIQLHGFGDSRQIAYSACVYIRIKAQCKTTIHLICSKSRIVPLKGNTIPKLELTAALMLAMLMSSIYTALQTRMEVNAIHCWTDSQAVLNWIRSEKAIKKPFVNSRVGQINSLVSKDCWEYCPSNVYPAYIASRLFHAQNLNQIRFGGTDPNVWKKKVTFCLK